MKFTFTTITLIIFAALVTMGMIVQDGGSTPDCLEVANGSVHAYYDPAFETALVGWFVAGEPLKPVRTEGNWVLVYGHGIDAQGRATRMSGWAQASYLSGCK